ncbi:MAG: hypothetical protein WBP55_00350 [Solirubrobacterales bacterium]
MKPPAVDGRRKALWLAALTLALAAVAGSLPATASAIDPDPAATGPFAIHQVDYSAGRVALTLPKKKGVDATFGQPLQGSVTYPATGSGWPVVVFLHGRHGTCLDRRGDDYIPFPGDENTNCPDRKGRDGKVRERRVRSYSGYGYIADRLASQGYLVVSADANRIASYEYFSAKAGIRARAQLVGATLDLIGRWHAGAEDLIPEKTGLPPVTDLAGAPDLGNIALMGHSRGGDAVTRFISFNRKRSTIYPLNGVVAIGPTDMAGDDPFRSGATNLAELLPGCDGDVADLQGGHVFERVKNSPEGKPFAKYQWLLGGANHNWFNTIWKKDDADYTAATALDSACGHEPFGSDRLGRAAQRSAGLDLVTGFVRTYAGGEGEFAPALETGSGLPGMRASYIGPKTERRLIVGPAPKAATRRNNLGGAIRRKGLKLSWCDAKQNRRRNQAKRCPGFRGGGESTINRSWTRQLVVDWKRRSRLVTELPRSAADASVYRDLVFRAVTTLSRQNPASRTQRLDVVLKDHSGSEFRVAAESYSKALQPPAGDRTRQLILSDIRIPLVDFTGVNLADVASVRLEFGNRGRTHGQVQIADLAFQGSIGPAPAASGRSATAAAPFPGPATAVDAILTVTGKGPVQHSTDCPARPASILDSSPRVEGGRLVMSGRLESHGCDARVQVALFDRTGNQCRFVSAEGRYGEPASCGQPYSLIPEVTAGGEWSLSIPWTGKQGVPDLKLGTIPL